MSGWTAVVVGVTGHKCCGQERRAVPAHYPSPARGRSSAPRLWRGRLCWRNGLNVRRRKNQVSHHVGKCTVLLVNQVPARMREGVDVSAGTHLRLVRVSAPRADGMFRTAG